MPESKSLYLDKHQLLVGFGLWFLSIPINILPVLMEYISLYETKIKPNGEMYSVYELTLEVFGSLDFLFVIIVVFFVMCIQSEFLGNDYTGLGAICKRLCFIEFIVLLVFYMLVYSYPVFRKVTYENCSTKFNVFMALTALALGYFTNLLNAVKVDDSEDKI